MTTHVAEEVTVPTDATTTAGRDLSIVTAKNGMYQIKSSGAGAGPFDNQNFTSLIHAKRAIAQYEAANAGTFNKKKALQAGIERRQRAAELKNGELTTTVNGTEKS